MEEKKLCDKERKVWKSYEDYSKERINELVDRRNKWTKRVRDFFVYGISWTTREKWRNMKWYLRNIRKFLHLAKEWRPWDYRYQVDLFKFGLTELADYIDKRGNEEDVSRTKKIAAITKLIAELDRDYEHEVYEKYHRHEQFGKDVKKIVEYEDGSISFSFNEDEETKKKNEIYNKALIKARKEHYNTIFKLILGQDNEKLWKEVDKKFAELPEEEQKDPHQTKHYKIYAQLFDGSGIEGWWD